MDAQKHHITPLIIYLGVGATLLFLTVVTVWSAGLESGVFKLFIALTIATIKAALVGLIFMHLLYDNKFYMMIFLSSIMFLAIFISLTMLDTLRRGDIDSELAEPIRAQAVIYTQNVSTATGPDAQGTSGDVSTVNSEAVGAEMGKRLFETLVCASCHNRPAGGVNIPPGLEFSGSKYQPGWLADFLQNPYQIRWLDMDKRPVVRMPDFNLSRAQAEALAAYLLLKTDSIKIAPTNIAWENSDPEAVANGRSLFNEYACSGCHKIDGEGAQLGPDLSHVGSKLEPDYIYRLILKPNSLIPGTPMKDNELWEDEAEAIVRYLQSLK
jgi:cytochrome c oxidase subunit 4